MKLHGVFSLGEQLDDFTARCEKGHLDGLGVMRHIRDSANPTCPISHVEVKGPLPGRRGSGRRDDSEKAHLMEFREFIEGQSGSVLKCASSRKLLSIDSEFELANWIGNVLNPELLGALPSLQFMHAPFVTETHVDNFCVVPCLKQVAGVSLFLVWDFQEGIERGLDGATSAAAWADDGWQKFFAMRSSRLLLLRPGDYAMLRPGAFHRVFTIETKVVAYVNFLNARALWSGLDSLAREVSEPGHAADRISPVRLLLEGLRHESTRGKNGVADLFEHMEAKFGPTPAPRCSLKAAWSFFQWIVDACARGEQRVYDVLAVAGDHLQTNLLELLKEVMKMSAQPSSKRARSEEHVDGNV